MSHVRKKTGLTLKDIGEMAGVSTATVSRALTFPEKVSARAHHKIEQAMLTMGYVPHSAYRRKKGSETRTVMILVDDDYSLLALDIIQGVKEAAMQHGYLILISYGFPYQNEEYSIKDFILAHKVDGILLLSTTPSFCASKEALLALPPIVMANGFSSEPGLPSVHIDSLTAAYEVVRYLYQIGHTRIAHIAGPERILQTHHWLHGYNQALQRFGIAVDQCFITYGDLTHESGMQSFSALMALPEPPTAVFCQSDAAAVGVLSQAKNMKLCVPDDISIIAAGNTILARGRCPELTTIGPKAYQVGLQAMRLLLSLIHQEKYSFQSLLLDYELSIGQSSAPRKTSKCYQASDS